MRPRLKTASSRLSRSGSTPRASGVARFRSGTRATNSSASASGNAAWTGAPPTDVAATSPPNALAAAFSGCPSYAAATAKGSSAPAAAAAAAARAAEEPRPRATGICERTVTAKRSCPSTSATTRAARCDASSKRPAPSPSVTTRNESAGTTSTLT